MTNRIDITTPLVSSAAFLALVIIVAAVNFWSVLAAAIGPGLGENAATAELDKYVARHNEQLTTYRGQFDGRSIFRNPPPTPKPRKYTPPPPVERKDPEPTGPVGPPPPPARYGGKPILFVVGNEVWFENAQDPFRVRVDETVNDHTVVAVDAPKSVTIAWRGGEFVVPIFDSWNTSVGLRTTPAPKRPVPGLIETTGEDTAPGVASPVASSARNERANSLRANTSGVAPALGSDADFDRAETSKPNAGVPQKDKTEKGPPE